MPRNRRNRQFWQTAGDNNRAYFLYMERLTEIALSRFKWSGLPDTIDERFMEMTILSKGCACFFEDEVMGHLALPAAINGPLNVYNIPINRRAYASNGYNQDLTIKNSVLIFNNKLKSPSIPTIEWYAYRLWDLDRSVDVNAKAQKTPILILCDDTQRLSMLNLYKEYDGNAPVIFGNKTINTNEIKTVSTNAPFVGDKLSELKRNIWNEALSMLGVANVEYQKRERLIRDEITSGMGGVIANLLSSLTMREAAAEQINAMFGLNVKCELNTGINPMLPLDFNGQQQETVTEVQPE